MADVTLYHNPRCSKSRRAKELLDERGVDYDVVAYLEAPPTAEQLADLQRRLGVPSLAMVRQKEDAFAEQGLEGADDATLLAAIAAHPKLLERPVVVRGDRAVIARPPERLEELF